MSESPRWVTLAVAAMLLRKTTQETNRLGLTGEILRRQRRVTYHAVKPCWMYSIESLMAYKKRQGERAAAPRWTFDVTRVYIRAHDAAAILECSTNAVYTLGRTGEVATKKTRFLYPTPRTQLGFSFGDVMALKVTQARAPRISAFEEETVISQTSLVETRERGEQLSPEIRAALRAHAASLLELANAG